MTKNQKKTATNEKMRKPRSSYREHPTGRKIERNLGHPSFLAPKNPLEFIENPSKPA
jgi:hypothetical protein